MKFDHIGIFVSDLDVGRKTMSELFPINEFSKPIDDVLLKVKIQFCVDGSGVMYELVAPLCEDSPVRGVISTGKGLLNHVAYRVPDINRALCELRGYGSIPICAPQPAVAFNGAMVGFLFTPLKFIMELIEENE